jgi:TRAP-type C4-dicarboxylate transport system permease small subunit
MVGMMATGLRRLWRWYDASFENAIMVPLYAFMTALVAVEVLRRFFLGQQATWGAPVAVYLFIWISWLGCSLGVKRGSHLAFPALRQRLSRGSQRALRCVDNALWIALCPIVLYGAVQVLQLQRDLESNITGTDVPVWWAILVIPLAWLNIVIRAVQNIVETVRGETGDPAKSIVGVRA